MLDLEFDPNYEEMNNALIKVEEMDISTCGLPPIEQDEMGTIHYFRFETNLVKRMKFNLLHLGCSFLLDYMPPTNSSCDY